MPEDEDGISAAIDGEITPEIERRIKQDADFAAQVEAARQFENKLKSALFRWDCPTPEALGEYQLQLISGDSARAIEEHLEHCVHCQAEIAALQNLLALDERPTPESPPQKPRWSLPRLGDIIAILLPPAALTPALALRGDAKKGPQIAQAGDITIFLETETKAGAIVVRGQIVVNEMDDWKSALVTVYQRDAVQAVTTVDELGTFVFSLTENDPVTIRIEPRSGKTIAVQDFRVGE